MLKVGRISKAIRSLVVFVELVQLSYPENTQNIKTCKYLHVNVHITTKMSIKAHAPLQVAMT